MGNTSEGLYKGEPYTAVSGHVPKGTGSTGSIPLILQQKPEKGCYFVVPFFIKKSLACQTWTGDCFVFSTNLNTF